MSAGFDLHAITAIGQGSSSQCTQADVVARDSVVMHASAIEPYAAPRATRNDVTFSRVVDAVAIGAHASANALEQHAAVHLTGDRRRPADADAYVIAGDDRARAEVIDADRGVPGNNIAL